jgi:hypothetical protein
LRVVQYGPVTHHLSGFSRLEHHGLRDLYVEYYLVSLPLDKSGLTASCRYGMLLNEQVSDFLPVAASFTLSRSRATPSPTAYALTNGVSNTKTVPHDIQTFPF